MEFLEFQATYNVDRRGAASNARLMLPFFADKYLDDITTRDVQNMITSRRLHDISGHTCNRNRAFMSKMFNWAIDQGYATGNPVRRVKKFRETRKEPPVMTPEQARDLVAAAEPRFRMPIVLALRTGGRLGELRALTPADVELDRCLIRFREDTTKARRERLVRIRPSLRDALVRYGVGAPDRRWVLERKGRRLGGLRYGLEDAREKIGLPWVTWITLRHTHSAWYLTNGGNLTGLQYRLGHASPTTTMIYRHFVRGYGQDEVAFLVTPRKASRDIEREG